LQGRRKVSSVADLFGIQGQSRRQSASSWLHPARGATVFAAKRLLGLAAVLLVISFGTFSLLAIAPGDPAQLLLGTRQQSPAVIHAVRHEYHLDRPFLVQYGIWLQHALHFDFGRSIRTQDPVWSDISSRYGPVGRFVISATCSLGPSPTT